MPTGSDQAADLMYNLLEFNPEKRLTAVEALRHPYLAQFHNPADEPSCDHIVTIPIDDNSKYTIQEYREKLYSEIVKRKKVYLVWTWKFSCKHVLKFKVIFKGVTSSHEGTGKGARTSLMSFHGRNRQCKTAHAIWFIFTPFSDHFRAL